MSECKRCETLEKENQILRNRNSLLAMAIRGAAKDVADLGKRMDSIKNG